MREPGAVAVGGWVIARRECSGKVGACARRGEGGGGGEEGGEREGEGGLRESGRHPCYRIAIAPPPSASDTIRSSIHRHGQAVEVFRKTTEWRLSIFSTAPRHFKTGATSSLWAHPARHPCGVGVGLTNAWDTVQAGGGSTRRRGSFGRRAASHLAPGSFGLLRPGTRPGWR